MKRFLVLFVVLCAGITHGASVNVTAPVYPAYPVVLNVPTAQITKIPTNISGAPVTIKRSFNNGNPFGPDIQVEYGNLGGVNTSNRTVTILRGSPPFFINSTRYKYLMSFNASNATVTPSSTPTLTPTKTATKTPTSTPTNTPTQTPTPTGSLTPTFTSTPTKTPTNTATNTATSTTTSTTTKTATATTTATPTKTVTQTPTVTPTPTWTPLF